MKLLHRALVVLLGIALIGSALVDTGAPAYAADSGPTAATAAKAKYTPPLGAVFANPLNGHGRDILRQVHHSIEGSPKGSEIRLVVWNFDDPAITNALIAAKDRGVQVQVVVAESVANGNFARLREYLDRNPDDKSFAIRCHNSCRSNQFVMHAKIFLFSHVGKKRHISMFGSTNLTVAAGNRQWNDQTTTTNRGLYDFFVQTFDEYAADTPVATGDDTYDNYRYHVVLFPVPRYNPIARALAKVGCFSEQGRTVVRIAVAGWFDEFGINIARQVRRLWDRGCDIRIVTTLAGRKINRVLQRGYGRGRVPIRQVTIDNDQDGIPERYMHMKSIAINGKYDGDPHAHLIFTGSPNWSGEARASDEVWVTVRDAKNLVRDYSRFIDQMFNGPAAHLRLSTARRPDLRRGSTDPGYELS